MNKDIEMMIENWSHMQKMGVHIPCPRCGKKNANDEPSENALSRRADIYICDRCGTEEAMEDLKCSEDIDLGSESYKEARIKKWWLVRNVLENENIIARNRWWEFRVSRTVVITKQDIDDIMVSALEGGINYWCKAAKVVEDKYYGEFASDQISRGGSLRLYDYEEDEQYILTLEKFLNGVQLAFKEGYGDNWYSEDGRLDVANIDAESADIIVQLALFGEVVYG